MMQGKNEWFMGKVRRVHFVGIGGIGMSGLAEILMNLGFEVQGSDQGDGPVTRRLSSLGADIWIGHSGEHIRGADVLVYSSAVRSDNPERTAARRTGIPEIRRAELLAELMRLKYGIAIAGTHGKTTTTSMIALVLEESKLDPTILIGGNANNIGTNARIGRGPYFVAEADESDASFLLLSPAIAVVTNVEEEHMDYYQTFDRILETFSIFLSRVPFFGAAVVCGDDRIISKLTVDYSRRLIKYGLTPGNDIKAMLLRSEEGWQYFQVFHQDIDLGEFAIRIPGRHMVLNALAAIAVGLEIGIQPGIIRRALRQYKGVKRRLDRTDASGGIILIDDYAHHPTEIEATVAAVRQQHSSPIHAVFQPHRYTRTAYFMDRFAAVLKDLDQVILLPIYPASEPPLPGITSNLLAERCRQAGCRRVEVVNTKHEAAARLIETVRPGEIILTLGAGDVFKINEILIDGLAKRESG
ncbi:UDP-N-acetylmuramate--L-alanine ligase [bacterium]|nr:UDP-N-acetylmuramate--L-alanine ligase [candidate division CSSED10-310 bacterium]